MKSVDELGVSEAGTGDSEKPLAKISFTEEHVEADGEPVDQLQDVTDVLDDEFDPKAVVVGHSGIKGTLRGALFEGHQWWDATLCNACSSIGQIILSYPYQLASTGIIAGLVLYFGTMLLSIWSIWLLTILFAHRKYDMVKADNWYDDVDRHGYRRRKTTTQMHDLIGFGGGWYLGLLTQAMIIVSVIGTGTTQIVASSSSEYAINKSHDKRTWSFIFGPILCIFAFLPTARSNRLLNIIGLCGTNFSCLYIFITAVSHGVNKSFIRWSPPSRKQFFTGAAVLGGGSGQFSAAIEMMDSMRQPRRFDFAFSLSVIWTMFLVVPHSTAVVLAYPVESLQQSNVYSILPASGWRIASVYIMLIHNIAAFTLHVQPLMFITERILHTQKKSYWIRLPSRIPTVGFLFFLAIAIPFYGTLNSLFAALAGPGISFVLPPLAFSLYYRTKARRDACPKKIPKFLAQHGWLPIHLLNIFLVVFFAVFGMGFEIYYAILTLTKHLDPAQLTYSLCTATAPVTAPCCQAPLTEATLPQAAAICSRLACFTRDNSNPMHTGPGGLPNAKEAAALDELIDSLMKASSQPEFEKLVAENILSFDQKFWIRVATRSDAAEPAQKNKLSTLARSVMLLVDAIVKRTSLKMTDSASVLQEIVRAAADERGEWHLPLTAQQRAAMQQAMEDRSEHLDEALLSNAYAWMRKASDDGLEGVVGLIQKVLQVYAALALKVNSPDKSEVALNEVLAADEGSWSTELQERKVRGDLDEAAFMAAIRRRMERVVLTLDSGSHAQRIQAEFLKELETRATAVLQQHGGF
ncbi:hypothetical protein WJX73_001610 [Symbiochloris irregularis]|uniref:Amino acid transporter transmembrane domain-containing protein n=1 Tax=Symbiochloris irregularis TaxID=706552 RepID=A0AAW1PLJ7_9CHLO